MQVAITCRHGSVKQEFREYIIRKSEKLLRFLDQVSEIDVTFEFEGDRVTVEILVEIEGHHTIVAQVEGEDARFTFDRALHKTEQQVHRYKEKLTDHRRDRSAGRTARANETDESAESEAGIESQTER